MPEELRPAEPGTAGSRPTVPEPAAAGSGAIEAVDRAERSVERACAVLARQGGDLRSLRAAVHGAARLTRSLATTVDTLARHVEDGAGHGIAVDELVADLRALRHCLATGAAVIDPALDDLHELTEPLDVDEEFAARFQEWARAGTES